jgi:hypothetical protein
MVIEPPAMPAISHKVTAHAPAHHANPRPYCRANWLSG